MHHLYWILGGAIGGAILVQIAIAITRKRDAIAASCWTMQALQKVRNGWVMTIANGTTTKKVFSEFGIYWTDDNGKWIGWENLALNDRVKHWFIFPPTEG